MCLHVHVHTSKPYYLLLFKREGRLPTDKEKLWELKFLRSPVEILPSSDGRVRAVRLEVNNLEVHVRTWHTNNYTTNLTVQCINMGEVRVHLHATALLWSIPCSSGWHGECQGCRLGTVWGDQLLSRATQHWLQEPTHWSRHSIRQDRRTDSK